MVFLQVILWSLHWTMFWSKTCDILWSRTPHLNPCWQLHWNSSASASLLNQIWCLYLCWYLVVTSSCSIVALQWHHQRWQSKELQLATSLIKLRNSWITTFSLVTVRLKYNIPITHVMTHFQNKFLFSESVGRVRLPRVQCTVSLSFD